MKLIHNNPYRIAGILSNATERELQKQKTKIKAYTKVGKEITFDIDFSMLKKVDRSEKAIEKAFSSIEQNQDKVNNSLFWFLKASPFDETAIAYLIDGDEKKAIEIWSKVTDNKEVNSKNFSAFNNIGTLKLLSNSEYEIKEGIAAKIKLIKSDYFEDFVHSVADQTFTIDNKKQSEILIDELLTQFKSQYTGTDALDLFSHCNSTTQKYLSKKFTEEPMHNIESNIESAKRKRKQDKSNAYNTGLQLFVNAKDDLSLLKTLLGENDLKYKMNADNLAKEVMQCGIDYFQEWKDEKDPSVDALKLLKYAKSVALGSQTKDRVKQNIDGINEWAATAPIQADLGFITQKLERFKSLSGTCYNAKDLVVSCKPKLQNIKNILGSSNELYLGISSAIVHNAQGMIVSSVNEAQERFSYNRDINGLKSIVRNALEVSELMGLLDMVSELRTSYNTNHRTLKSIGTQIERGSSSSDGGGCYIATMAYGYYEHPQVIKLRKFRDNILRNSLLGRSFIHSYYKYSPTLAKLLKNQKTINKAIRISLDVFIKTLKK